MTVHIRAGTLAGALCVLLTGAASAQTCIVDDPTGTPLNVRAQPNGPILGALFNGARVEITNMTVDRNGKRWAYIVPREDGKRGWVFRAYLDCR